MTPIEEPTAAAAFADRLKEAAAHFAAGDHQAARALAETLVGENPDSFAAVHLLGASLAALGQLALGAIVLRQALALQPRSTQARHNLAMALEKLGRPQDAAAVHVQAAATAASLEPAVRLAETRMSAGDTEAALTIWQNIAGQRPEQAHVHRRMGDALHQLRRSDEAVDAYRRALRLSPQSADAHAGLGRALVALDRADEAVACYLEVLGSASVPRLWSGLGLALLADGRPEEALAAFDHALQQQSDYIAARWNRSIALLSLGRFEEGWRDYELRWRTEVFRGIGRLPIPLWLGDEDIAGRTVLLPYEQGHGDTIQFVRLASSVAARGAEVVLRVQPPLVSLIRSVAGIRAVLSTEDPVPAADFQCSMLSLPHALRLRLDTIPTAVPYLQPTPAAVERWRGQLPAADRPRIGLVWAGTPAHGHDRARTLPLTALRPLLQREDVRWIVLQKEARPADWDNLWSLEHLHLLGPRVESFEDTAAIIAGLDLVIAVDTSVAHLAGAMGKPVWILLPVGADYRWMYGTDRSPWYPTARLFRRQRGSDWAEVIERIGTALDTLLGAPLIGAA